MAGRVWKVGELLEEVRDALDGDFGVVVVEGEVAERLVARSGHVYFALKDDSGAAVVRCVMWRGRYARRPFDLEDGRRIRARVRMTIYPPRGAFQLDVRSFDDAGEGALARKFREVVERLEKEGLTDPQRRRPLPFLPRRVGVVTSPDGAAIRDVLRVLERRFPVSVLLAPSPVQGDGAPGRLRAALERLDGTALVDVIIIGRGGGSADDLAAFNDEALARAVGACRTPVISAVGHEVDVSVTDLVADRRAATPSEAAELAVPSREDVAEGLRASRSRLDRAVRSALQSLRNDVYRLDGRVTRPDRMISDRRQRLDEMRDRIARAGPEGRIHAGRRLLAENAQALGRAGPEAGVAAGRRTLGQRQREIERRVRERLGRLSSRFAASAASLEALSPLAVLARGYGVVRTPEGAVVRDARETCPGDHLRLRLHRGRLAVEVTDVNGED